jgi:hypothetical protein
MEVFRPAITAATVIQNQLLIHSKTLDNEYRLKLSEFENLSQVIEILRNRDDIISRKKNKSL